MIVFYGIHVADIIHALWLATGSWVCNHMLETFQTNIGIYLITCEIAQMWITYRPIWQTANNGFGKGSVPSSNKPLSEPTMTLVTA